MAELYTLPGRIVRYVNYISIKMCFKRGKKADGPVHKVGTLCASPFFSVTLWLSEGSVDFLAVCDRLSQHVSLLFVRMNFV